MGLGHEKERFSSTEHEDFSMNKLSNWDLANKVGFKKPRYDHILSTEGGSGDSP